MNQQSTKKIDHMNYFKLTLLMCWMSSIPLLAQPFITFGGGVSSLFVLSDELDNFTDTYNAYNVVGTAQELNGVGNGAIGYQMEAGFRHYNQFHLAINFGYQRNMIRDGAEFGDQTTRDLKFTFTGIFSELEFGKQIDQYFVNGVLRYAFRRKVEIEATHSARETPLAGSLDGDYVSPTTRSAHAGISLGALKEPFVIGIKVLYPVFIGGDVTGQVAQIKQQPGPDLHVWGSGDLLQTLIQHDLVDVFWLMLYPTTLGSGKRLFANGTIPAAFKVTESEVTPSGVFVVRYERNGRTG